MYRDIFGDKYCSKCNFKILELDKNVCPSCGENLLTQSKNRPKYKSNFWQDIKEILSNILSGDISNNAKGCLNLLLLLFLAFIFWLTFVIPPEIGKYFNPLKNFILYFWNFYILLWEYFGIDTSSTQIQMNITYGVIGFLGIIVEIIKLIDEKHKFHKSIPIIFLIIVIILASFARANNLGDW